MEKNGSRIWRKEDEKIPLVEILKRMKRKRAALSSEDEEVLKRTKIMEEKIPLPDFYRRTSRRPTPPMSKMEEEIVDTSSSSPISKKEEIVKMSSSLLVDKKESRFLGAGKLFDKSSEEDSEEEKKHIRRSPVYIKRFSDFVNYKLMGIKEPEEEPLEESDEELLRDRNEVDHGYNYVLKKRWRAITNVMNPQKTYHKRGISSDRIRYVLHDPKYPVVTLSKLSLRTYNDIQGTQYEFVGLVKAYMQFSGRWRFWIRFKAAALGQDAINFQAGVSQGIRYRNTNVVPVWIGSVYPLPP